MTGDVQGSWRVVDPKELYGLDLNEPDTLRTYDKRIRSVGDFGSFLAFEFGFDKFFREVVGRYLIMPFFMS